MENPDQLINAEIEAYAEQYSNLQDEVLYQLYRETNLKTIRPRMLTGHLQGLFLQFISKWVQPGTILEIGTYTGYGTICLSRGMKENGMIHTIEKNPEVLEIAQKYFRAEGISAKVHIYREDALKVLKNWNILFDLVFIDGDKQEYPRYLEKIKPLMKKGGILLLDNVLWNGKVLEEETDAETEAIKTTNQMVNNDWELSNLLLPLRDGLMIAEKMT